MDLTYKDKSYIRAALDFYMKHLQKYNEDDEGVSEELFSEMQDDIVYLDKILYEFEQEMAEDKALAGEGAKLYELPSKKNLE